MYKLKEIEKGYSLLGKDDNQLILFLCEDSNRFHVIYNNTNIDKENLCINAVDQYGEVFDWYVNCNSKNDCLQCCSRFMNLVTNGFITDSRKLIAMDWGDLERASKGTKSGLYYYVKGDSKSINDFFNNLYKQLLIDYDKNMSIIICLEGNVGLQEFNEIASHIKNYKDNVVQQLLIDKNADNVKLDIWINPLKDIK